MIQDKPSLPWKINLIYNAVINLNMEKEPLLKKENSNEVLSYPLNAEATIQGILNEISVMGANDSEYRDVQNILEQLRSQQITDAEAITQVQNIRNAKQDYH